MKYILLLILSVGSFAHADVEDNYNIRFSPLGLLIGLGNARFDFKVDEQFTLGPSVVAWNLNLGDVEVRAFGASANGTFYFNRAFEHSWVMDGSLGFASFKVKDKSSITGTEEASASAVVGSITGGYHWFWGNTFNLAVLGGIAFNTVGSVEIKDGTGSVVRKESVSSISPSIGGELGFTF